MSEQDQLPFLPVGWIQATLGEICFEPEYGWTTSAEKEGTLKFLRTTDISKGTINWETVPFCKENPENLERFILQPKDIVISRAGSIGLSALIHECPPAVFASYLIRFRPVSVMNVRYVSYFLNSPDYWRQVESSAVGIALQNINATKLSAIKLLLAPLAEQERIVDEIEKQFSRLDAAVEILQRVKRHLERLRTATLRAAVEGRLVPTEAELARAEGCDYEPADMLLQRILLERRAKWEADQLAKMKEQGRTPKNDKWKARYQESPFPDSNNLPILPEGWVWVTLGQLTWSVKDGPHYSPEYVDEGIPFITGGNIRPSGVDFDSAKRISPELHKELSKRVKPEVGDILYTKGGTTGIARVNTYEREFNVWVHVAVLKLAGYIEPFYVQHALNSPQSYAQARRFTHGVGNQDLGLTRMIKIVFGLPPRAEQQRIVAEIERRISVIEELKTLVTNALRRASILRQKILRAAFAGKLVPQDPADEPASILLEHIRAEKVEREAEAQQARKERRGKMKGRKARPSERKPRRPLRETIADSKQRLTPEELFTEAGFTLEVVEDFYEELRREINAGYIEQVRPNDAKVYLVAASA